MAQNRDRPLDNFNAHAFWDLVRLPISAEMVFYISEVSAGILYCNPNLKFTHGRTQQSSTSTSPADSFPNLFQFITRLIHAAKVPTPTLISTLVYLRRLKTRLSQYSFYGVRCTAHRIFLTALILTSKYLNDQSPSNKKWAQYCCESAGSYSLCLSLLDIRRLEIQTLDLLGWKVGITADDLCAVLKPLRERIRWDICYGMPADSKRSVLYRNSKRKNSSKGRLRGRDGLA